MEVDEDGEKKEGEGRGDYVPSMDFNLAYATQHKLAKKRPPLMRVPGNMDTICSALRTSIMILHIPLTALSSPLR